MSLPIPILCLYHEYRHLYRYLYRYRYNPVLNVFLVRSRAHTTFTVIDVIQHCLHSCYLQLWWLHVTPIELRELAVSMVFRFTPDFALLVFSAAFRDFSSALRAFSSAAVFRAFSFSFSSAFLARSSAFCLRSSSVCLFF